MASSHSIFSVKEAISYGWKGVVKNLGLFIPLSFIVFGSTILFQILNGVLQQNDAYFMTLLLTLAFVVLQFVMAIGVVGISLDFVRKKKVHFSDLFTHYHLIFRYLFATILMLLPIWAVMGLGVGLFVYIFSGAVGDVSFVIPLAVGLCLLAFIIYWQTKLQFYVYFLVDKNAGVVESLRKSFRATDGYFWGLFWLGLLLGIINLFGLLLLGIGLLVTAPLDWVARAHVYDKLVSSK